jgi:hypothetical protein
MLRNDMLYGPQGPYTSEGTPLIVGGANQVTSPLASMSTVQQPQGMVQLQAMAAPQSMASQPSASITYDPTKSIDDQIKALTNVNDKNSLFNQYNAYKNVSSMFGITDPTLLSTIASNPNLNATDISNLARIAKTTNPQNSVAIMNQLYKGQYKDDTPYMKSLSLASDANSLAPTAEDLKFLASRASSNIQVPVYRPASQSTNAVGDVFTTKNNGIVDQYKDQNGYVHVTSGGNQYLLNPNSNRIVNITPITHSDPNPRIWASGASGSGIAGE